MFPQGLHHGYVIPRYRTPVASAQVNMGEFQDLQRQVKKMQQTINELHKRLNEIYYAPGNPGAVIASQSFKTQQEYCVETNTNEMELSDSDGWQSAEEEFIDQIK